MAAVRVHADRVHDLVRRQGCPPGQAPEVVERTALELVGRASREGLPVPVLVGQWAAAAAERASGAGSAPGALPLGSGPLADDAQQTLLAEVVDATPEPARTALLLTDAYDLTLPTVAAALRADPDDAALLVGRARLAALPRLFPDDGAPVPSVAGHRTDEPGLARLAAGGAPAPQDATTARHARACSRCRAVVEAQEDVRRLLAGLSVVALPDDERESLLVRVGERAGALLPAEAALLAAAAEQDEDDEPRRLLSPLPVLLSLGLAVVGGVGLGVLLSQRSAVDTADVALLPAVTAPPLTPVPVRPRPTPTADPQPSTRVFTLRPTTPPPPATTRPPRTTSAAPAPTTAAPTPTRTPTPTPTGSPADAAVEVDPAIGGAGATVVVTGTGWEPGSVVSVSYLRLDGSRTGSTASAQADDDGAFRTSLVTLDEQAPTGDHVVLAGDGTTEARTTYEAL